MEKLRTHLILEYLKAKKRCTLLELMKKFKVSSATIHRDVDELCQRDAVTKVRGGLVWNDSEQTTQSTSDYRERVVTNRRAKIAVARKALSTIVEGDIVFLDSSTTVYELAMLMRHADFQHMTIVTNSVSIMQNFRKFPSHWALIALGGNYDPQLNSILGASALEQFSNFNVTKAFVSAFGMDRRNVTTNHERQAEILRHVLKNADKRYLLMDRSKIGRKGLYRLSPRGTFDAIITD